MIKDSSRPCDGTHFFNQWAAFTTSLNISSESGRTFGDACQLFYCFFAGILDMRKGRKLAWLLGFRLRLTTLVTGTINSAYEGFTGQWIFLTNNVSTDMASRVEWVLQHPNTFEATNQNRQGKNSILWHLKFVEWQEDMKRVSVALP